MFERRLIFHVDWLLLIAILTLTGIGVTMIYSTTYIQLPEPGHPGSQFYTQIYAILLGLGALFLFLVIDYRKLAENSLVLYGGLLALLVYVLFKGSTQYNATRWIDIGPFNLQPSEFGRVTIALMLAMFFGENRRGARNLGDLAIAGIFAGVPILLIARQPDLGTAVTLIPVAFGIAYLAGLRMKLIGVLALAAVLMAPVAWNFALKDYQKTRITTFINPDLDPQGDGYQQRQARITVGSGGLVGKGFMKGTQGQVQVPAGCPQRFHLLGAGRGKGVRRRPCGAGTVSVRHSQVGRRGPSVEGPHRRVPRRRDHFWIRVPGDL